MDDSKKLWLSLDKRINASDISLGRYSAYDYINDPQHFSIAGARYKFCAHLLNDKRKVLEVGCGDGFFSAIVAKSVEQLILTDINRALLKEIGLSHSHFKNVQYQYFDFREKPYSERVDAIYMIDVIEHIYPAEEPGFLFHLNNSLNSNGVLVMGTPNITAKAYASNWSNKAHVNLKSFKDLKQLGLRYFEHVFMFCMNDEVVHTGYPAMAHFLWALCINPKEGDSYATKTPS